EPSAFPEILDLTRETLSLKKGLGFRDVKLIMITNGSGLGREECRSALTLLFQDGGEVWAKLDAGTEGYYQTICRTPVAFDKILKNLLITSQAFPMTIQTCFMNLNGRPPSGEEISAYCGRLFSIKENNGQIRLVQLYTVARKPAELFVSPLTDKELEMIAEKVRKETGLPVETFV
ncbi:MAG TPA: radical SAM protein, partial [Nitrospiria bacterium]|nr:radical SAM protein [Nitrospiria bacterium]